MVGTTKTGRHGLWWALLMLGGLTATVPCTLQAGASVADDARLWPKGRVPYEIGGEVADFKRENLKKAMKLWQAAGVVTFEKRRRKDTSWVTFREEGSSCASVSADSKSRAIGRFGGPQVVQIGGFCGAGLQGVSSLAHEIGHVLGLYHETCRTDRDANIRVDWDNVRSDWLPQVRDCGDAVTSRGPYDLASLMHYPAVSSAVAVDSTRPWYTSASVEPAERKGPSPGDLAAVRGLYGRR